MYNNTVSDQLKLVATLNNDLVTFSHAPRCVVKLVYFPHQASEECRTCVKRCGLSILQIVGAKYNLSTIHSGPQTRILNRKCSSSRTLNYYCSLSPMSTLIPTILSSEISDQILWSAMESIHSEQNHSLVFVEDVNILTSVSLELFSLLQSCLTPAPGHEVNKGVN